MSLIDLNILETEPSEVYHGKSKDFLSSHQLIEFMNCPYLYQKRRAGLIEEKESSSFLIGRAAHCRQRAVALQFFPKRCHNVTINRLPLIDS
jgi:hypothetical protein